MVVNKEEINPTEAFTSIHFNREEKPDIFIQNCPHCYSEDVKFSSKYETKNNGERTLYTCQDCGVYFSETYGSAISFAGARSAIAGLNTPLSDVARVLKARTEGMGLNASERVFGFSKKTILNWEERLAALKETLLLYALVHKFLQLEIEGDELYTKVNRNERPSDSEGWTIVLLERASRFIWTLECGRKEQRLFLEALATLVELFDQSEAIALFTDGERRYGKLLFDVCHEIFRNGKQRGLSKVLPKGT